MAEIPTNPSAPFGGTPPPKKETGKVQPKKETVRINLPPKPSAAPTIKLPTLPPGGPTGVSSPGVATPAAAATVKLPSAPRPTAAATVAAPPATASRTAAAPATAQPVQPRAVIAAVPVVPAIRGFEKAMIFASAVLSLVAVGIVVYIYMTLQNTVTTFTS